MISGMVRRNFVFYFWPFLIRLIDQLINQLILFMEKILKLGCACEKPDSGYTEFRSSVLGTDNTSSRNAEVSFQQCKLCQRIWVVYTVQSGDASYAVAWYKGIVSKKDRPHITPEKALDHLENLEWYVYGGDFFENTTAFGAGKITLD